MQHMDINQGPGLIFPSWKSRRRLVSKQLTESGNGTAVERGWKGKGKGPLKSNHTINTAKVDRVVLGTTIGSTQLWCLCMGVYMSSLRFYHVSSL